MTSSSSFCFPPAHSWYSPHVLATSDVNEAGDGAVLLAYHSKLDVVLLDPTAAKPSPRVLRGTYEGKAKLCAVDVNASGTRVAVGVDDGTVRMWDVSSKNDRQIALSSTKHTVHRDLEKDVGESA
jgi:WD40 repeat protein